MTIDGTIDGWHVFAVAVGHVWQVRVMQSLSPFTRSEGAEWVLTSLIRSMVGCRFQSE